MVSKNKKSQTDGYVYKALILVPFEIYLATGNNVSCIKNGAFIYRNGDNTIVAMLSDDDIHYIEAPTDQYFLLGAGNLFFTIRDALSGSFKSERTLLGSNTVVVQKTSVEEFFKNFPYEGE